MALNVNKVELIGNLGRDPEVIKTSSGGEIAVLSLATTDRWKDRATNADRSRTDWHRIKVLSPALVDIVKAYARKGQLVRLEGRLHTSVYEKEGEKRYSTEIILGGRGSFSMLSARPANAPTTATGEATAPESQPAPVSKVSDEDIPF